MQLSEIIIQKIKSKGAISFHDFMEMALYYPDAGYYASPKNKIGADGDYYTSCYLTHLFGEMIAMQLEEMWELLGKQKLTVVEYGAGNGFLCRDILQALKKNDALYEHLQYCIIEKTAAMRAKEKYLLQEKVRWIDSINELSPFTGCILSNELLDNFAVHQVVMQKELQEVFVDYDNEFKEVLQPASAALNNYFSELDVCLPRGFRAEVNLEAIQWLKEIAAAMEKGFVITIDYGFPSSELYGMHRSEGTLVAYNKHRVNTELYTNIGEQDITAHVNFSALHYWGLKNELGFTGYTDQASFLLSLGIKAALVKMLEQEKEDAYKGYQKLQYILQHLLVEMGSKYKILIQQKGLPKVQLKGFNFANPRETLHPAIDNARQFAE